MKTCLALLIIFLFGLVTEVPAQNGANKSKAYAVKAKTHSTKAHARVRAHAVRKARGK